MEKNFGNFLEGNTGIPSQEAIAQSENIEKISNFLGIEIEPEYAERLEENPYIDPEVLANSLEVAQEDGEDGVLEQTRQLLEEHKNSPEKEKDIMARLSRVLEI